MKNTRLDFPLNTLLTDCYQSNEISVNKIHFNSAEVA